MPARGFDNIHPDHRYSSSWVARWLLRRLGWQVKFDGLPGPQGVLAVYPHTSNWDFVVLILVKWAIGVQVRFWGKAGLFRIPLFGPWLRWLGGVPVERTAPGGRVGQAVDLLAQASLQGRYFWLALAPEGTRKWVPGWRSGFYRTAVQAGVPLGLVRLDYARREVAIMDFIHLTGDEGADFKRIATRLEDVVGRIPGNAAPIRLLARNVPRTDAP